MRTSCGKKGAKRLIHMHELKLSKEKHSSMAFSCREVFHSENDVVTSLVTLPLLCLARRVVFDGKSQDGDLKHKNEDCSTANTHSTHSQFEGIDVNNVTMCL